MIGCALSVMPRASGCTAGLARFALWQSCMQSKCFWLRIKYRRYQSVKTHHLLVFRGLYVPEFHQEYFGLIVLGCLFYEHFVIVHLRHLASRYLLQILLRSHHMCHWVFGHYRFRYFYSFGLAVFLHFLVQMARLNIPQHFGGQQGICFAVFLIKKGTQRVVGSLRHTGMKYFMVLVQELPCGLALPQLSRALVYDHLAWPLPASLRFGGIRHVLQTGRPLG